MPDNGWLVLRTKNEVKRVQVRLGRTVPVEIGGREVGIEFDSISSGINNQKGSVNLDRGKQRSEDPWLYLKINGRELPVPRDDTEFTKDFRILEGVELRFDWPDSRDAGVENLFRIVEGDGMPR